MLARAFYLNHEVSQDITKDNDAWKWRYFLFKVPNLGKCLFSLARFINLFLCVSVWPDDRLCFVNICTHETNGRYSNLVKLGQILWIFT